MIKFKKYRGSNPAIASADKCTRVASVAVSILMSLGSTELCMVQGHKLPITRSVTTTTTNIKIRPKAPSSELRKFQKLLNCFWLALGSI